MIDPPAPRPSSGLPCTLPEGGVWPHVILRDGVPLDGYLEWKNAERAHEDWARKAATPGSPLKGSLFRSVPGSELPRIDDRYLKGSR